MIRSGHRYVTPLKNVRNSHIGNRRASTKIGYKKNVVLSRKGSTATTVNRKTPE